ncbi:PadR family transcriptional regulator [Janibacter indicus]|uniref:PadR family transcriptional regulator n=1 Tax=Janibacter indicus TaxID=857417 RepID=UPI003EBDD8B9
MELRHALLGLISLRPMSGYDLGRAFAGSVAHFWHADQSQIYRTLERLTASGAITTRVIPQEGRPDRKVHSLTEVGHGELEDWLTSPVEADRPKEAFLARLFFAGPLGQEAVERLLTEREQHVAATRDELDSVDVPGDDLAAALRAATLRYGVIQAEAELAWLRETMRAINDLED